jgi:hypothetical protein
MSLLSLSVLDLRQMNGMNLRKVGLHDVLVFIADLKLALRNTLLEKLDSLGPFRNEIPINY